MNFIAKFFTLNANILQLNNFNKSVAFIFNYSWKFVIFLPAFFYCYYCSRSPRLSAHSPTKILSCTCTYKDVCTPMYMYYLANFSMYVCTYVRTIIIIIIYHAREKKQRGKVYGEHKRKHVDKEWLLSKLTILFLFFSLFPPSSYFSFSLSYLTIYSRTCIICIANVHSLYNAEETNTIFSIRFILQTHKTLLSSFSHVFVELNRFRF